MNRQQIQLTWTRKKFPVFLILFLSGFFFTGQTFARDSTCLLGDNGKIAITTYEHRATDGNGRETYVTLIYGDNFLMGMLHDADDGPIDLVASQSSGYSFNGRISIDYTKNTITLRGKLNFTQSDGQILNTRFSCRELAGLD